MNKKVRKPQNATLQITVAVLAGNAHEGTTQDLHFYLPLNDFVQVDQSDQSIRELAKRTAMMEVLQGAIKNALVNFNENNQDWEKENWGE